LPVGEADADEGDEIEETGHAQQGVEPTLVLHIQKSGDKIKALNIGFFLKKVWWHYDSSFNINIICNIHSYNTSTHSFILHHLPRSAVVSMRIRIQSMDDQNLQNFTAGK
jgi:hypothetical protein